MKPDEDDFRIGVPGATLAPPLASTLGGLTPPVHQDEEAPELRPGETELGRPPQVPSDLAPLSDGDLAALKLLDEEQAARDLAEAEMLVASDATGFGWLGWFSSPLAFAFLLGMTGVLGVFLFNQVASLLQTLAAIQEDWLRWTGYAGLGLFGLCVLYSFIRLAVLYARLRANRQCACRGFGNWRTARNSAGSRRRNRPKPAGKSKRT